MAPMMGKKHCFPDVRARVHLRACVCMYEGARAFTCVCVHVRARAPEPVPAPALEPAPAHVCTQHD
eukprot:5436174-Pleurochrysis_carterae.AAC.3